MKSKSKTRIKRTIPSKKKANPQQIEEESTSSDDEDSKPRALFGDSSDDPDDSEGDDKPTLTTEEKRDQIAYGDIFTVEKARVIKKLQDAYDQLEKRVNAISKKRGLSGEQCLARNAVDQGSLVKSSQTPLVLPFTDDRPLKDLHRFCSFWITPNALEIVTDSRSQDIYMVPLNKIVLGSDRHYIVELSKEKADLTSHDSNIIKWRYMVLFCEALNRPYNKFIRTMLVSFFGKKFDNNSRKLFNEDLENASKSLNCIIVFDRKKQAIPKLRESTSIVSAVCFSLEDNSPQMYIDYVATNSNFVRGSFASVLINVAQLFGFKKLSLRNGNAEVSTYIVCIHELCIV